LYMGRLSRSSLWMTNYSILPMGVVSHVTHFKFWGLKHIFGWVKLGISNLVCWLVQRIT